MTFAGHELLHLVDDRRRIVAQEELVRARDEDQAGAGDGGGDVLRVEPWEC